MCSLEFGEIACNKYPVLLLWLEIIYKGLYRILSIYNIIYIYNSVFTCRHVAINSSASTPLNATNIAVMKVSHDRVVMFRQELLFSMYKCCFGVFFSESARRAAKSQTNLSTANGPIGAGVAPPSVFH